MSNQETITQAAQEMADLSPDPEAGQDERAAVEQVNSIGQLILDLVETADPNIVPESWYVNLWNQISSGPYPLLQSTREYRDKGFDPEKLTNALAYRTDTLNALTPFATLANVLSPENAGREVSRLRRSVGAHIANIDAKSASTQEHLAELEGKIQVAGETAKSALDNAVQAVNQTLNEAKSEIEADLASMHETIDADFASLRQQIQADKVRVDQLISTTQSTFARDQETRQNQFTNLVDSHTDALENVIKELQGTTEQRIDDLTSRARERLDALDVMHNRAEHVYVALTQTALAGGYGSQAESERKSADYLRWAAVGLFLLSLIIAWASLSNWPVEVPMDLEHSLLKLGVTFAAAGLAGYVANQSHIHRKREEQWRHIQLQLAAAVPFLEQLDKEKRAELQAIIALRIFTGQALMVDKPEDLELVNRAVEASA